MSVFVTATLRTYANCRKCGGTGYTAKFDRFDENQDYARYRYTQALCECSELRRTPPPPNDKP